MSQDPEFAAPAAPYQSPVERMLARRRSNRTCAKCTTRLIRGLRESVEEFKVRKLCWGHTEAEAKMPIPSDGTVHVLIGEASIMPEDPSAWIDALVAKGAIR